MKEKTGKLLPISRKILSGGWQVCKLKTEHIIIIHDECVTVSYVILCLFNKSFVSGMKIDIDQKICQSKLSYFFSSENGRIKENN